jgi:hypothetical protein
MPTIPPDPLEAAREQLLICRHELALGARRLLADPTPSAVDAHLAASAILEYVGLEAVIEAAERESPTGQPSLPEPYVVCDPRAAVRQEAIITFKLDDFPLRWSEAAIALGAHVIASNLGDEETNRELDRCEQLVRGFCLDAGAHP